MALEHSTEDSRPSKRQRTDDEVNGAEVNDATKAQANASDATETQDNGPGAGSAETNRATSTLDTFAKPSLPFTKSVCFLFWTWLNKSADPSP
jgi:hypothetical protein